MDKEKQNFLLWEALDDAMTVDVRLEYLTSQRAQDWTERLREAGIAHVRRDGSYVYVDRAEFERVLGLSFRGVSRR